METIKGIDTSYWQGTNINWTSVSNAGVQFAYIKASEGKHRVEPNAISQATGAKNAGLSIGYYHFSDIDVDSPIDEANFFISVLKSCPGPDLIHVLDIETNKSNLSAKDVTKWMEDFVSTMNAAGFPDVMIYSYTPFLNQYLLPSDILASTKLWVAQYTSAASPSIPHGYSKFDVWQYSNSGKIDGIQGNVDVNICYQLPIIS